MPWAPKKPCRHPRCPELVAGAWCKVHEPEDWNKFGAAGRATPRERGFPRNWRRIRAVVLADDPECQVCHAAPSTEVDHIIPRSQGGTSDRENLQGICPRCHATKTQAEAAAGRGLIH